MERKDNNRSRLSKLQGTVFNKPSHTCLTFCPINQQEIERKKTRPIWNFIEVANARTVDLLLRHTFAAKSISDSSKA